MSVELFRYLTFAIDAIFMVLFARIFIMIFTRFEVLNEDHPWVIRAEAFFDALFAPLKNFIKRFIPEFWGIDLSIIVVIFVMVGARMLLGYLVG